ncbi:hypothetical protein [Pseudoduganella sp. OTU4001]|uniref:hypothetical protein n=1 Tax=Pseudoduganella sp. OTU4001 TaxID=3043854 RepID=UPI00313B1066
MNARDDDAGTGSLVLVANEIQLLLAEERTALSLLRTGITVFALPLSALGLLIATSGSYQFRDVALLLLPLLILSAALVALGVYLVVRGLVVVHRCERRIDAIKGRHKDLAHLMD